MKRLSLVFFVACGLVACGGEEKKESSDVKVAPEMTTFMSKLDGTSASVEAAIKEFGSDSLNNADITMYNLKEPKVTAANGNCFTMDAGSGATIRTYDICWENGKIKTVTDKGMR